MLRSWLWAAAAAGCMSFLQPAAVQAAGDKSTKKDHVAEAFETKAKLRGDQQQEIAALKTKLEPKLRAALDKVESTKDQTEKTAAAAEVRKIRTEIKQEISKILNKKDPNAPKVQPKPANHKPPKQPAYKPPKPQKQVRR